MKRALITGARGQDGLLLTDLLLSKGYFVHGVSRGVNHSDNPDLLFFQGDFSDASFINELLQNHHYDEIYHLAGESFPPNVDKDFSTACQVNIVATEQLIATAVKVNPEVRIFLCSSSNIFGLSTESPQTLGAISVPQNLYGLTKLAVRNIAAIWRAKGAFVVCGILYNHESRYRPDHYVTKKIVNGAKLISEGKLDKLELGNLDAVRDWSYAGDFVEGFYLALQLKEPDEYIFASGVGRTIGEFCDAAFSHFNLDYSKHVVLNNKFYREKEIYDPVGDIQKTVSTLGWKRAMSFADLLLEILK